MSQNHKIASVSLVFPSFSGWFSVALQRLHLTPKDLHRSLWSSPSRRKWTRGGRLQRPMLTPGGLAMRPHSTSWVWDCVDKSRKPKLVRTCLTCHYGPERTDRASIVCIEFSEIDSPLTKHWWKTDQSTPSARLSRLYLNSLWWSNQNQQCCIIFYLFKLNIGLLSLWNNCVSAV